MMRKFKKNTETKKQKKTTPYGRGVEAIDWSKVDLKKLKELSFYVGGR